MFVFIEKLITEIYFFMGDCQRTKQSRRGSTEDITYILKMIK